MPTPIPTIPVTFGPHDADWWMVWLTLAGVLATVVIALLTLRANKRADASREVADAAQVRALEAYTAAYNANAEASREQVASLRDLVAQVNTRSAEERAQAPRVNWRLEHDPSSKRRWRIRNVGTDTALDTRVRGASSQDQVDLLLLFDGPQDVRPEGALPFSISKTFASPAATVIEVLWSEADGQEHSTRIVVA